MLEVHPDREAWLPGETVTGILLLQISRSTEVKEVEAQLFGHEQVTVTETHGVGKQRHTQTYRESLPLVVQDLYAEGSRDALLYPGHYDPGTYTMPFDAPLPRGMPPSVGRVGGQFRMAVSYDIHARLSVPWRFDPHTARAVQVLQMPRPAQALQVGTSAPPGFGTSGTSIEGMLEVTEAPRGGWIRGAVTVTTTGDKRLNGVRVELVETASGEAQGHRGAPLPAVLFEQDFGPNQAHFGVPVQFVLPVPANAAPSYEGNILGVRHGVRCTADLAWAVNPSVTMAVAVS